MAYIYKITNLINKKCYIGKTTLTLEQRYKEHLRAISKIETCNRPLYNAMRKYGQENFKIEQIEECPEDKLNEREIYWINYFNSYYAGYNATIGGEGKVEVDRQKVYTLWQQGKAITDIALILKCNRGTIRLILDNYNIPKEERLKRGYIRQGKAVIQLDKNTNEILNVFPTLTDAILSLNKDKKLATCISDVCKGKKKTAYGYKWKFLHEEDN